MKYFILPPILVNESVPALESVHGGGHLPVIKMLHLCDCHESPSLIEIHDEVFGICPESHNSLLRIEPNISFMNLLPWLPYLFRNPAHLMHFSWIISSHFLGNYNLILAHFYTK